MYCLDQASVGLSIVACLFLAMILYNRKKKVHPNFPPGPPGLPFIGSMFDLHPEKPHLTFDELSKKFGPVYSIKLGTQKMVVLSGYETIKDVVVDLGECVDKANIPIFIDITKGNGISFSNGSNWKAMRRFTVSTLRDFGMGKTIMEERILEECKSLVDIIKSYKGKPFENTSLLNSAVTNVIMSILLGRRFPYDDLELQKMMATINLNMKLFTTPMVTLYNIFPSLVQWLPGSHKTFAANAKEMMDFIEKATMKHRNHVDFNDLRSFVDAFLVKQKEEKTNPETHFHDENLVLLFSELFIAGMETTGTTLRWALLLMMKYPEIQKKVQDEIEKVIGSEEPHWMHRKLMPYTEAVIHEIQRFANIVPITDLRTTSKDMHLNGFFIPKGTEVIVLLYSVLRDKACFERPEEFYPQHFLDSDGNYVKNDAFMPFLSGKRSCPGESLAKMELFLFFTKLLQNFTFQAPPGAQLDITADAGLTTPPRKHEICAIPRY